MEGREIHVGPVAHDVLPPGLQLDYDLDSETRVLDVMAPVLTPSLLSGLTGNIGGFKQPGILTQPASFEAGGSMGGHAGIPLKSEALGPSCEVDLIPPMPTSKEEVPKCEPSSHEMSHHDSPVLDVNPKDIAKIIVDDGDDLDLTIEEPQAISTPVVEPTPRRKWSPDDQVSSSSPSKKRATKEEGISTPHQEEDLPKGVKLEDILPKRYDTLSSDNEWVQKVRCSLLGLETRTTPCKEDINSSKRFTPRATARETEPPEITAELWLPVLWEEGILAEYPPDQFTLKPSWVPLYTPESLTKHLPAALSAFSGSDVPSLMAVVPPDHPGSSDKEFILMSFHQHGCLARQSLTIEGKRRQLAFCPYCGIINENANTALSHVRKHLDLLFVCGGCHTKSFSHGQALQKHIRYQCLSAMAILDKPKSTRR